MVLTKYQTRLRQTYYQTTTKRSGQSNNKSFGILSLGVLLSPVFMQERTRSTAQSSATLSIARAERLPPDGRHQKTMAMFATAFNCALLASYLLPVDGAEESTRPPETQRPDSPGCCFGRGPQPPIQNTTSVIKPSKCFLKGIPCTVDNTTNLNGLW